MHAPDRISFIYPILKRSTESVLDKCTVIIMDCIALFFFGVLAPTTPVSAQTVLFDFDNIPIHTPLSVSQTVSGITAHFSGTGQGYSIQEAGVLGFTPQGFSGHVIYPNSIYLADLLIRFDQTLADFSIVYSCQELGCDDAATMRVSTYRNGRFIGTNTKRAGIPGTWPVDTLSCGFPQGFDSVVVHYDSRPPTCKDYGVVYMADDMRVIRLNLNPVSESEHPAMFALKQNYPNPFNPTTTISFALPSRSFVSLKVFDPAGREAATIVSDQMPAGNHRRQWNADGMPSGVYFFRLQAGSFTETKKLILLR
jgi:hypothetical protein